MPDPCYYTSSRVRRGGVLATLLTILTFGFVGMLFADTVCELYAEYQRAYALIESQADLLANCRSAQFHLMLGEDAGICAKAERNYQIGAFMLALKRVSSRANLEGLVLALLDHAESLSWKMIILLAGACFLVPSTLLHFWRRPDPLVCYTPRIRDHNA